MAKWVNFIAVLGLLLLSIAPAEAEITRIEILRTEPAFGGASFGDVGFYQHFFARAYGEVDPAAPENAIIQDLALAPRDPRGMVEYVRFGQPARLGRGHRQHLSRL